MILGAFFAVVDQAFNLGVLTLLDLSETTAPAPSLDISDITTTPVEVDADATEPVATEPAN